MAAKV